MILDILIVLGTGKAVIVYGDGETKTVLIQDLTSDMIMEVDENRTSY